MGNVRNEIKINALRDVVMSDCVCLDCGNKFKGLPVDNVECPACRSKNLSKK